ncbi:hypothetical protein RCZ04_02260 [Capnocytophaga sp. HP1101]
MKRFLSSLLALVALVGCNSKDDNTPTPTKTLSEQQQAFLPTKKVQRVNCTYIEEGATTPTHTNDYLKTELYNQTYTLRTAEYLYEYDNAGRINKVTIKQEGKPQDVRTFTYKDYSVIISAPYDTEVDRDYEYQSVEYGLNASGNILGFGVYNEKQQLKSIMGNLIHWEGDNITKITDKDRDGEPVETVLTYYSKENKNKFFNGFFFESSNNRSFMEFFETPIALIIGHAPKNLLKKVVAPSSRYNGKMENKIIDLAYTFDSDGFVKNITETEYFRKGTSVGNYYSDGSYGGNNEATTLSNTLQDLMTKIDNGTVTDKSYKVISDKQDERVIQFTIPVKVEKDSNNKPLNLMVDKICKYTLRYTTENNQKKLSQIELNVIFKPHLVTHYELHY